MKLNTYGSWKCKKLSSHLHSSCPLCCLVFICCCTALQCETSIQNLKNSRYHSERYKDLITIHWQRTFIIPYHMTYLQSILFFSFMVLKSSADPELLNDVPSLVPIQNLFPPFIICRCHSILLHFYTTTCACDRIPPVQRCKLYWGNSYIIRLCARSCSCLSRSS